MIKMLRSDYQLIVDMLLHMMDDAEAKYSEICGDLKKQDVFYREIGRSKGASEVLHWFFDNTDITY